MHRRKDIIQRTVTVPMLYGTISLTLIGKTLKIVSACGGNDNSMGARGCFHETELYNELMFLK